MPERAASEMSTSSLTPQRPSEPLVLQVRSRCLGVVSGLFNRLNEADIPYCHWKSNEHLSAAVAGFTDLDVLVDRHHSLELQRIFSQCGFKRFTAPPLQAYPAIEDYIGFDDSTGRLAHLHLHYELTLGEQHLKGYRLPWEDRILKTRRFERKYGIYVTEPSIELLLLLLRAALKERARDRLRRIFSGRPRRGTADFEREFAWLREQVDEAVVLDTARRLLGKSADQALRRLFATPPGANDFAVLLSALRPTLRKHRTYGWMEAPLRAWTRELHWCADAVNRRYLHRPTPLRRISPRGGTIVVLVGVDGSGKSTLSRTLQVWLGWKLDVIPIYFGCGDGPAAFYRKPLQLAHRLLRPFLGGAASAPSLVAEKKPGAPALATFGSIGWLRTTARIPWAVALSFEKRAKLRRMIKARNRGLIVICDRFPQSDVPGFNDGPLLAHWHEHRWRFCRTLAAMESRPYVEAGQAAPDLVIKLVAPPEVAMQRRPEMRPEGVCRRVQVVKELRFQTTTRVVELNADAHLDTIALAAKRHVWVEL